MKRTSTSLRLRERLGIGDDGADGLAAHDRCIDRASRRARSCLRPFPSGRTAARPSRHRPDRSSPRSASRADCRSPAAWRSGRIRLMKASTIELVEEPLVEKAMVLPLVSLSVLMPEFGFRVPVIGGAGGFRADDAHRRALGVSADRADGADRKADIDAVGDRPAAGSRRCRTCRSFEIEAVLLENAGLVAEMRDRGVPIAALADGELHLVLRRRPARRSASRARRARARMRFIVILRRSFRSA